MKEKKVSNLIVAKDGRYKIEGTEIYYNCEDTIILCINNNTMEFIQGVVKYNAYYKNGYYAEYSVKTYGSNDIFIMSSGSLVEYEIEEISYTTK
ncbi:hypothetical protein [Clostridium lacusfryxellense]|uniref:hypothetical protein n=1 Tax=Clostridium lacusfryxellense TaxID=205328 RepID=UPI001C0B6F57|nr:hypothetical protein [Clostridium lacusfryxellense]MBU3110311.1 hypothetical protein [Clostridium lacusfryxellense]